MKSFRKVIAVLLTVIMVFGCVSISSFAATEGKIDLAFVIDTTGSMGDDIYEVKENMGRYLDALSETGCDFRVAIVEYRDFPERTKYSGDYAYKVTMGFSNDYASIKESIAAVKLGNGGDTEETLYSALIDGLDELEWRGSDCGKAAIVMGDAPALDPEPFTGYTLEDVKNKLLNDKIAEKDERTEMKMSRGATTFATEKRSAVTVFTIATSSGAEDSFARIAEATNGKSYSAADTENITEIIEEIIVEEIPEVAEDVDDDFDLFSFFEILFYLLSFQWLWAILF